MKRPEAQANLAFSRQEKVRLRQWKQRASGKTVRRGPGRPKSKHADVSHQGRPQLAEKTALHVTMKVHKHVPNLRTRRRFSVVKQAFVKFCSGQGFRLVHFAVMSNHLHFVIEADTKQALSSGMQKLAHSISRRLNALNVAEHEGRVSTKHGSFKAMKGWLGKVFKARYHAHELKTPTEMQNAVRYVLQNADHHRVTTKTALDALAFTSLEDHEQKCVERPSGYLLRRACNTYLQRFQRRA